MGTKTSAEIMQALDDLLREACPDGSAGTVSPSAVAPWTVSPSPVSLWTVERKRRAINRAIRSAWPSFKIAKENASAVILATGRYEYSLADIGDIGDLGNGAGICQVLLELAGESQEWVPLRTVTQARAGRLWYLYVPEPIVDANIGRKLKLRYYAHLPEFTPDEFTVGSGALADEFAYYVLCTAAVDLMGLYVQCSSDDHVQEMLRLIPPYSGCAWTELRANTVNCMPILMGERAQIGDECIDEVANTRGGTAAVEKRNALARG